METSTTDERIKEAVRDAYGGIARRYVEEPQRRSCCGPSQATDCCGPSAVTIDTSEAATRLYSTEELADLPESVTDISLGCGNPTAIAGLKPGEVVLDLGSGGGIDCRNAKKVRASNVEFRFGEMEDMPLPDESVDVIISNCVINLSPDKDAVFGEAYRVLRAGGRMSVSDIVVQGNLPPAIRDRLDAWAGCVAGSLDESDYLSKIRAAGFEGVEVQSRDFVKISEFGDWEGVREIVAAAGMAPQDLDTKIASIRVKARKPA